MSGFPTPRFGRALRLFTPVVLVAALAVPLLAPAKEHAPKNKAAQSKSAPVPSAPQANPTPAAPAQSDNAGQPADNGQPAVSQPQDAADGAPANPGDGPAGTAAVDNPGQGNADPATPAATVQAQDAGQDDAGAVYVAESYGKGDDHGKDKDKSKKDKDKSKKDKDKDHGKADDDHGKGHDKDHGKDGDDHGKDKGDKDKDKGDKDKDKDKGDKDKDKGHGKGHHKGHKPGKDGGNGSNGANGANGTNGTSAPLPAAVQNAVAQVMTQPRTCTSRRALSIRLDRGYRVRAASVMFNGKLVRVRYGTHGRNVNATINLRGQKAGTYTVRTVVVTKGGRIRMGTRRFRTCSAKIVPVRRPHK
jgi:hypothetical protein